MSGTACEAPCAAYCRGGGRREVARGPSPPSLSGGHRTSSSWSRDAATVGARWVIPWSAKALPSPCTRAVERGCRDAPLGGGASSTLAVFFARARSSAFSTQARWSTPRASRKRFSCAADAVAKSGGAASCDADAAESWGSGASRVAAASPKELRASSRPTPAGRTGAAAACSPPKRSSDGAAAGAVLRPPKRSVGAALDPRKENPLAVFGVAGAGAEVGGPVARGAGTPVRPSRKSKADICACSANRRGDGRQLRTRQQLRGPSRLW